MILKLLAKIFLLHILHNIELNLKMIIDAKKVRIWKEEGSSNSTENDVTSLSYRDSKTATDLSKVR
jgi:hypothetical protein